MALPSLDTSNRVVRAWSLIERLKLNDEFVLRDVRTIRFRLVNAQGEAVATAAEAHCIFDMQTGKHFLPQLDADWFEQLLTRFRVGVHWSETLNAWVAEVAGIVLPGATPGDAVVNVLVAAAEAGRSLTKHPFSLIEGTAHA